MATHVKWAQQLAAFVGKSGPNHGGDSTTTAASVRVKQDPGFLSAAACDGGLVDQEERRLFERLLRGAENPGELPPNQIPRFYFGRRNIADSSAGLAGGAGDVAMLDALRRCAKECQLHRRNQLILSNEELDAVWVSLEAQSVAVGGQRSDFAQTADQHPATVGNVPLRLDYDGFRRVRDNLNSNRHPHKFHWLFSAGDFLRLPHDDQGRIDTRLFFNYVLRRASLFQERVCIGLYDTDSDGYLTEQDLENYVTDLIPNFPQLQIMERDFMSFYLCGVSRKFFFYLDGQRKGKIAIAQLLLSPILSEMFELQHANVGPDLSLNNWFSLYSALGVYSQYVELDVDQNGMLSRKELESYAKYRYNRLFIHRVFEECQTFGGEMDYKNYLDFVLALNDVHSPSSISYLFRILDINGRGYWDRFGMAYFAQELSESIGLPLNMESFLNELYDMTHPADPTRITSKDLIRSRVGGTVISLLIDSELLQQSQLKD